MENIITASESKRSFHLNQGALAKYMGWSQYKFVPIDSKITLVDGVTMDADKANRRISKLFYGDQYHFYSSQDGKLYMSTKAAQLESY